MDPGSVGDVQDLVTTGHHPILEEVQRLKALVRFSRSGTVTGDAGLVGQDTERVLREFGYGDAEIAALAEEGVIVLG
jgi:crotonobetainyl-CoA:carnitine CoA-transferase CaiB-like acyl-CoA transferase